MQTVAIFSYQLPSRLNACAHCDYFFGSHHVLDHHSPEVPVNSTMVLLALALALGPSPCLFHLLFKYMKTNAVFRIEIVCTIYNLHTCMCYKIPLLMVV